MAWYTQAHSIMITYDHGAVHSLDLRPSNVVLPTFDSRINKECEPLKPFFRVVDREDLLVCTDSGGYPVVFSETTVLRSDIKKAVEFVKVNVIFPFSLLKEISYHFARKQWYDKPKACMMGYGDTTKCKLDTRRPVTDTSIQKKSCYFVHGVGESGTNSVLLSFPEYWGDMGNSTPQCTTRSFLYMDTRSRSFTDAGLLRDVCNLITNKAKDKVIRNSYVFTHSMGGLIMTNAVLLNYCTVDKVTSRIYMSQPPSAGSLSALYVDNCCKGLEGTVVQTLAAYMNYCLPGNAGAWPAYFPMDPDNPILPNLAYAAGIYADGLLCGNCNSTSICGAGSAWQTAGLKSLAIIAGLPYPNDGMVAWNSCVPPNPKYVFSLSPTANYYAGPMNHADGTCRNGDNALLGVQACAWFSNRYMSS